MKTAAKKATHPNRMPFEGVLTTVDIPSDKAPGGSFNHRVILTRAAAEEALETLEHMAIDFAPSWNDHDARRKCGVITKAWMDGDDVRVSGFVYCRDFPEIADYLRKPGVEMGMSYELAEAHVKNMRATIWELTKVTFVGAAVLLRSKAAYGKTRFNITAAADTKEFDGKISFIDLHVRTGRAKAIERRSKPRSKADAHPAPERTIH